MWRCRPQGRALMPCAVPVPVLRTCLLFHSLSQGVLPNLTTLGTERPNKQYFITFLQLSSIIVHWKGTSLFWWYFHPWLRLWQKIHQNDNNLHVNICHITMASRRLKSKFLLWFFRNLQNYSFVPCWKISEILILKMWLLKSQNLFPSFWFYVYIGFIGVP